MFLLFFSMLIVFDHRNLNPDNEMKKKFGNSVIQGERR